MLDKKKLLNPDLYKRCGKFVEHLLVCFVSVVSRGRGWGVSEEKERQWAGDIAAVN
jgi:hypothetical protein